MFEPLPLTSLLVAIPKRLCLFQTLYDSSIRSSLASIGAGSFTKWERPLPFMLPSVPRPLTVQAAQGDELNHAVQQWRVAAMHKVYQDRPCLLRLVRPTVAPWFDKSKMTGPSSRARRCPCEATSLSAQQAPARALAVVH